MLPLSMPDKASGVPNDELLEYSNRTADGGQQPLRCTGVRQVTRSCSWPRWPSPHPRPRTTAWCRSWSAPGRSGLIPPTPGDHTGGRVAQAVGAPDGNLGGLARSSDRAPVAGHGVERTRRPDRPSLPLAGLVGHVTRPELGCLLRSLLRRPIRRRLDRLKQGGASSSVRSHSRRMSWHRGPR
jgi:hypothetical protein